MIRAEQRIQQAIADLLHHVLPDEVVWSAVGHGGGGKTRGAILKSMGLLPGVPDMVVMWRDSLTLEGEVLKLSTTATLWLEVKSPKGRQSSEQREFQRRVVALGHRYHLVHSPEEAYDALRRAGCPVKGVHFAAAGAGYRIERLDCT